MSGKINHHRVKQFRLSLDPIPVRGHRGFTLMEVMVAVTILALSFMVVMENFSVSMGNIHRVGRASEADYQRALALERLLVPGLEKDPAKGDIYVLGSRYQLVIVKSDENGRLTSLRLEKIR